MQHITGISRNQMTFSSLEEFISANNPIRFIDAFVEHIDLKALDFTVHTLKTEGRPSFDTKITSISLPPSNGNGTTTTQT